MEVLAGDAIEGRELVDAGIVHQDIELAELLLGFGKQPLDVGLLGHVGLDGDRLAALAGDFLDHLCPRPPCWTRS